jgi:hypothetical protein
MRGRPSASTWSRQLRREHRTLAAEWARVAGDPAPARLRLLGQQVIAHLAAEQEHLHPLVHRYLPSGTGTIDAVQAEHATFISLVDLLDRRLSAPGGSKDDSSVSVIVRDIEELWRTHVRRFDRAIGPVLRQLDTGRRSS